MARDTSGRRFWYVIYMRTSIDQQWTFLKNEHSGDEALSAAQAAFDKAIDQYAWVDVRIQRQYK